MPNPPRSAVAPMAPPAVAPSAAPVAAAPAAAPAATPTGPSSAPSKPPIRLPPTNPHTVPMPLVSRIARLPLASLVMIAPRLSWVKPSLSSSCISLAASYAWFWVLKTATMTRSAMIHLLHSCLVDARCVCSNQSRAGREDIHNSTLCHLYQLLSHGQLFTQQMVSSLLVDRQGQPLNECIGQALQWFDDPVHWR